MIPFFLLVWFSQGDVKERRTTDSFQVIKKLISCLLTTKQPQSMTMQLMFAVVHIKHIKMHQFKNLLQYALATISHHNEVFCKYTLFCYMDIFVIAKSHNFVQY